jgi:hypothetical protein
MLEMPLLVALAGCQIHHVVQSRTPEQVSTSHEYPELHTKEPQKPGKLIFSPHWQAFIADDRHLVERRDIDLSVGLCRQMQLK